MGQHVKLSFLIDLVNQSNIDQEKNCHFCSKSDCLFCQRTEILEGELREKQFNTKNANIKESFIIYFQKTKLKRFSSFNMSKKLTIKYFPNNEFAREPFHALGDATGYDAFAAETKTLLPQTTN